MKCVTMHVAKEQLSLLFSEYSPGDVIVLTDGDRHISLEPSSDLLRDSTELGEELLKAASGPFSDYSREDLEAVAARVLREKSRE